MSDRAGGHRLALLVAVDSYQDPDIPDLRAPRPDTNRLAQVLGDPAIGAFTVQRLINPTHYELHLRIAQFYDAAGSQDVLLLFFAGHGFLDDGTLLFAGTDTRKDFLRPTALAAREVTELAQRSGSRRIVIILDCCYSARFFDSLAPRGDDSVHLGAQMPVADPGLVVLAASESTNYAYEDKTSSQYTRLLVQGLRTGDADLDGDGWISADELHGYVSDEMRGLTRTQRPQRLAVGGNVPITVARAARESPPVPARPRPAARPSPRPTARPATAASPRPDPVVGTAPSAVEPPVLRSRSTQARAADTNTLELWVGFGVIAAVLAGVIGLIIYLVSKFGGNSGHLSTAGVVAFWILAVFLVVAGILALFRRQFLWGVVLIIFGLCAGPGAVSFFS